MKKKIYNCLQESMSEFGCTTPFGYNVDNICTDNVTGKSAFDLYERISNKRYTMDECPGELVQCRPKCYECKLHW